VLSLSDASHFRRTVAGTCLIAAPLAGLTGTVIGAESETDAAEQLAAIADNQEAFVIGTIVGIVALVLLLPAVLGLLHLLRDRAVALGHLGGALALVGIVGLAALQGVGLVLAETVTGDGEREQMVSLVERVEDSTGFIVVLLMFLVGLNIGLILLAAALWRARVAPAWVTLALAASVIVLFLGSDKVLGAIGFALLALAFGWVGRAVLAQPDDDWDVRPTGKAAQPPEPDVP
jgi:MFS family permease